MAPIATSPTASSAPLPPAAAKDKKAAARERFEGVYEVVRDDLLEDFRRHNMPEEAIEYYRRVSPTIISSLATKVLPQNRAWTIMSQAESSTEA
jgi:hypothetical protein